MKEEPKLTDLDKALGATYPGEIEDYSVMGTVVIFLILAGIFFDLWYLWNNNTEENKPDQKPIPAEAPLK